MKGQGGKVPAGFRLVTCTDCNRQVLVPDGGASENCHCGSFLPSY